MSLEQYIRLIARRLLILGIALYGIGLYLGYSGGFEPWLTAMTWGGAGVGVISGVVCLIIPNEPY